MIKPKPEFRPLLAASEIEHPEKLRFPLLASPKLDGIRCICHPKLGIVTRKLKPVPNVWINGVMASIARSGLDGELIVGSATDPDVYNRTQSGVMSRDGCPDFAYHVFDSIREDRPFEHRMNDARAIAEATSVATYLDHFYVDSLKDVEELEEMWVERGYEGAILRDPKGRYKQGRSTEREGIMMKLKRFVDDEAIVTGWTPLERNLNEATVSELGFTKRSTHKAGKVAEPDLVGALELVGAPGSPWAGVEFSCGSGMDVETRRRLALDLALVGSVVSYKYQKAGSKDRPRMPIFKGIRRD